MEIQLTSSFAVLAAGTFMAAVASVCLRNLVHCALSLAVALTGLAGLYLQLNAQFVGFAQILVYIGAVAILIVFAILLTRGAESDSRQIFSGSWLSGSLIALVVFGAIAVVILSSKRLGIQSPDLAVDASTRKIGTQLMTQYILPLEVLGLLLTAALLGAVLLAMKEDNTGSK